MVAKTKARYPKSGSPAEDRQDLAHHAHRREDDDVDLRVAEEPEEVLPEDRVASGVGVEEAAAVVAVDEERDHAGRQDRRGEQDQGGGDEHRPDQDRHPEEGHPRRPHLEDGGDEVDRSEDRGGPDQEQADEPQVGPDAARVGPAAQGGVEGPALGGRTAEQVAGEDQQAAEGQEPEAEGVDAREGHVGRADLERHDVVREAGEDRHHEQEDHDRAVHREGLVVGPLVEELEPRDRQLGAHQQRQDPRGEEEEERVDDVQDPDLLVIDRRQPVHHPGASIALGGGAQRRGCHRFVARLALTGRSGCRSWWSGGSRTGRCNVPAGRALTV